MSRKMYITIIFLTIRTLPSNKTYRPHIKQPTFTSFDLVADLVMLSKQYFPLLVNGFYNTFSSILLFNVPTISNCSSRPTQHLHQTKPTNLIHPISTICDYSNFPPHRRPEESGPTGTFRLILHRPSTNADKSFVTCTKRPICMCARRLTHHATCLHRAKVFALALLDT